MPLLPRRHDVPRRAEWQVKKRIPVSLDLRADRKAMFEEMLKEAQEG